MSTLLFVQMTGTEGLTRDNMKIIGEKTIFNTYVGGVYQQATSGLSVTNQVGFGTHSQHLILNGLSLRTAILKAEGASPSTASSTSPEQTGISPGSATVPPPGLFAEPEWPQSLESRSDHDLYPRNLWFAPLSLVLFCFQC